MDGDRIDPERYLVAMRHSRVNVLACSLLAIVASGCDSLGPVATDRGLCPQSGEHSNYGCARFVAILTTTSGAPASGIAIQAIPIDTGGAEIPNGLSSDLSDAHGRVGLQLTWFVRPPPDDTVALRLVALRPGGPGQAPERIDSLDGYVVFARVGQRPPVDTTRWQLRQ